MYNNSFKQTNKRFGKVIWSLTGLYMAFSPSIMFSTPMAFSNKPSYTLVEFKAKYMYLCWNFFILMALMTLIALCLCGALVLGGCGLVGRGLGRRGLDGCGLYWHSFNRLGLHVCIVPTKYPQNMPSLAIWLLHSSWRTPLGLPYWPY